MPKFDDHLHERMAVPAVVGPFIETICRYATATQVSAGDLIAAHIISLRGVIQAGVPPSEWKSVGQACGIALQRDLGEFGQHEKLIGFDRT